MPSRPHFSTTLFALLGATSLACSGPPQSGMDASADAAAPLEASAPDSAPEASAGRNVSYTAGPTARTVEPGVRREVFRVAAPAPPANPGRDGAATATPAEQNFVQVLRYRADVASPAPVRTVVVAMPGFLGGAPSFEGLARTLVRRAAMDATSGGLEVWALDRRSNLLEDLRGMDAADALRDPELARAYYIQRNTSLNGQRFAGFPNAMGPDLAYLSEWGLATTLGDLDAVVNLIPDPQTHVVLLGHSLGASIVEAYAAWDFNGTPGYRKLAGLVLVDGVLSGAPLDEMTYTQGGGMGPLGMPVTGVNSLRASGPYYFALPLLGVRALVVAEIIARRAQLTPDAVVEDPQRDELFNLLLGATPHVTNAAAFGLGFDSRFNPLSFVRMTLGQPAGGPVSQHPNAFAPGETLDAPADDTATYRWVDALQATPAEFTTLARGTSAWAASPSNFGEWYFPTRLPLDVGVLGDLRLTEASWQWRYGLRARFGGQVDVPVLGIAAALVGNASAFDVVRARLSSTVGTGRPNAGATRAEDRGFRALAVPGMAHLDPVAAGDENPANVVPGEVARFAASNTTGSVTLPVR